jgi:uncharacterized protein YbaR (Trm112 family)/SAM-dependent methyltransferase
MNLQEIKLSSQTQNLLCCPSCQSKLKVTDHKFECINNQCQSCFPIINGTPVLIDDDASVFSTKDYLQQGKDTTLKTKSKLERTLIDLVPSINFNLKGKTNYQNFTELILKQNKEPKILIIGGSVVGQGIKSLMSSSAVEIVESDVVLGDNISVICDAHEIPFEDNSFDGVVVQAVLEHVVDPYACVDEIFRILKDDGLVYSETPFMQQVHLGKYDFTRFTHLGHRRLFRKFEEVSSGPVCGPGMALAWTYQYFLLSFVRSETARNLVKVFARLTSFWLKYFDYYLINKAGSFDSASAYFFLGKKSNLLLGDKELLSLYKGNQQSSF